MSVSAAQIEQIAQEVGTPFYLYDAAVLRRQVAKLQGAFPSVEFVYSLKANPNISVVKTLTKAGTGAEVCSLFELETCVAAGVPAKNIIFVGPAKSKQEIERAVSLGVKAIIVESLSELDLVNAICKTRGRVQAVALRINPDFHTMGAKLSMSGRPTQFGIDQEEMGQAVLKAARLKHIRLVGLHVYMGTRILNFQVVVENTKNILALANTLAQLLGRPLEFVDVGGGFGVPYHTGEPSLDIAQLGSEMTLLVDAWQATHPSTRIITELGRYMVAESGHMITRLRYTKTSKGKKYAICDGGSNCHSAAGQAAAFRKNFPIKAVQPKAGPKSTWSITGPLCTPTDVIAQDVTLADLKEGDLLMIGNSGAYGPTASPVHFLSFGFPAEVMVDAGMATLIRAREQVSDLLQSQHPRPISLPTTASVPTLERA